MKAMSRFLRKAWQVLSQVPLLSPSPTAGRAQLVKRLTQEPPRPLSNGYRYICSQDDFLTVEECSAIMTARAQA